MTPRIVPRIVPRFAALLLAVGSLLAGVSRPAAAASPGVSIRLTSQTPVVGSTNRFELRTQIRGTSGLADRPGVEIATTLYQRIRNRRAFTATLSDERLGSPIQVTRTPLPAVDQDGNVANQSTFEIGACAACVTLVSDGVYPVVVEVRRGGGGEVLSRLTTYLIRLTAPAGAEPLDVALVVPLHLPPAVAPDGSATPLDISGFVTVAESLGSHPGAGLTLVPTPESIDALARLKGGDGGALDTLRTALDGREVVAGPYVDMLTGAIADPRLASEVVAQLDEGRSILRKHLGADLSEGVLVRVGSEPLPDRSTLDRLKIDRLVVSVDQVAGAKLVGGAEAYDHQVIYDPGAGDNAETNALPAVIADPGLAAHLAAPTDALLAAHHLIADLTVTAEGGRGPRGVVVALPSTGLSRRSLDLLLGVLGSHPLLRTSTASSLFSLPGAVDEAGDRAVVSARQPGTGLLDDVVVARVSSLRRLVDGLSTLSDEPGGEVDLAHRLLAVALARDLPPSTPMLAYLDRLQRTLPRELSKVHLGANSSFRLTALRGRIPLTVINDTGHPVKVQLDVSSDRLRFPKLSGPVTLAIDGRTHTERIDVASRSSGTFSVLVRLSTPSGLALANDRYTVRSTGVSGVGVGLSIGALLILATWWGRTTVRRRREADHAPSDALR